jgi:hypothetical protein
MWENTVEPDRLLIYTHNTCFFPTATVVSRTRLRVAGYVHLVSFEPDNRIKKFLYTDLILPAAD